MEVGFGSESVGNGIGEPLGGRGGSLLDGPDREGAGGPGGSPVGIGTDKPCSLSSRVLLGDKDKGVDLPPGRNLLGEVEGVTSLC